VRGIDHSGFVCSLALTLDQAGIEAGSATAWARMKMPFTGTETHRGHRCDLRGLLGQGRSGAAKPTADRAGRGGSLASGNKGAVKLPCTRTRPKEQNTLQGEFYHLHVFHIISSN
jgi:hypothetical protein